MSKVAIWAVAGMLLSIPILALWVDIPVAQFVHDNATSTTIVAGSWLEEIGKSHWVLIGLLLVFAVTIRTRKNVARSSAVLFSAIALSGIAANIVKILVCRSRPPLYFSDHIYTANYLAFQVEYLWNSFPSGHATTGLAIALAGHYIQPRLRVFYWIIGLAIAFGRIVYNVHYVSDVVGGMALAIAATQAVMWWDQHFGDRLFKN